MIIYKLEINEIDVDSPIASIGTRKVLRAEEFYLNKEAALNRQIKILDAVEELLGFIPKIEVVIEDIFVSED